MSVLNVQTISIPSERESALNAIEHYKALEVKLDGRAPDEGVLSSEEMQMYQIYEEIIADFALNNIYWLAERIKERHDG